MSYDGGLSVVQTMLDSGYIIAGYTESFAGYAREAYFIKTDECGDTIWTNRTGTYTTAVSVIESNDGGYAATGNYYNNGYANLRIWKLDTNGNCDWDKSYSLDHRTYGQEILQTADEGYIIAGTVYDTAGYSDVVLLKTDSQGDTTWTKRYDLGAIAVGLSVDQTFDGGYVIAGYVSAPPYFDVLLLAVDASGDTLWTRCYGGNYWDEGHCVRQSSDGGFIIAGQWGQASSDQDVYVIKTNEYGDTLWTRRYNGGAWDCAESIEETDGGRYIVAGRMWQPNYIPDVWLLKIDASGDTLWTARFGGAEYDEAHSGQPTNDGGYVVVGYTRSFGAGESDVWLLKIESDTSGVKDNNTIFTISSKLRSSIISGLIVLPEDAKHRVFDITGRVVEPYGIQPGIYFIEVDGVVTQKVVKVR